MTLVVSCSRLSRSKEVCSSWISPDSSLFMSSTLLTRSSRKPDAVDGGAQIVAHAAQKIRLGGIGTAGFFCGGFRLVLRGQLPLPLAVLSTSTVPSRSCTSIMAT